jgi:hypothetical protein
LIIKILVKNRLCFRFIDKVVRNEGLDPPPPPIEGENALSGLRKKRMESGSRRSDRPTPRFTRAGRLFPDVFASPESGEMPQEAAKNQVKPSLLFRDFCAFLRPDSGP